MRTALSGRSLTDGRKTTLGAWEEAIGGADITPHLIPELAKALRCQIELQDREGVLMVPVGGYFGQKRIVLVADPDQPGQICLAVKKC